MKVPINLASEPYENLRPWRTGAWLAATVLVILAAVVVWTERENRNQTQSLSQQISGLEREMRDLRQEEELLEQWLETPQVRALRDRSAFLNSLILRKSLSWTRLFMDLEEILPERAQIVSIQPSLNEAQEAVLNLTVAAATMGPLVEFLKNLESSPQFGSPVVASQRYPSERTQDGNISMGVTARYRQNLDSSPASALQGSDSGEAADPVIASAGGPEEEGR